MLKIRFKMLLTVCITILLTMLPKADVSAADLDKIVFIDGIEYNIESWEDEDGKVHNDATMGGWVREDVTAPNGVLTLPAKVSYEGREFIVRGISSIHKPPEFIKEVVIPEDFGTYKPEDREWYYCGLMNVKKMTVLSDFVRLSPRLFTDYEFSETWRDDYNSLEEVEIRSSKVIVKENFFLTATI